MTTATATRPVTATRPAATTSITMDDLRDALRLALAATDSLSFDDPVWADLVPYVDELDRALAQAVGRTPVPIPPAATGVLRVRSLIVAARNLRARDVTIVHRAAANRATELAVALARAGVTGIVQPSR